jgi:ABC-type branched-subunit amino acid transport system permease subunit
VSAWRTERERGAHMNHAVFSNRWLMAVVLLALPLVLQSFGNAWVRIADMSLLYVLLALGLNIVVGYAGLLDLGYVAFFAVGAYMFGLFASPHLSEAFPWIAIGRRLGGFVWRVVGRAYFEIARRLFGHRHLGFW